jgi:uncharacterized protein (UPF0276 family)
MRDPRIALGVGLGYREELNDQLLAHVGDVDFLEIVGDQCFELSMRSRVVPWARKLPTVCHFLGLSLGTDEPLDERYVAAVEEVLQVVRPHWFSDHLAMTRVNDVDLGHLAPVNFTDETVEIVGRKAAAVQARCGLPLLLENITYHFALTGASMTEWELLTRIVETADCGILLDLTNLYVNAHNNLYDPYEFLRSIPLDRVVQVHIAGTTQRDGVLIDSHAHPVPDAVFEYLQYLCRHSQVSAVLLERDRDMPPFEDLSREMERARSILRDNRPDPVAFNAGT